MGPATGMYASRRSGGASYITTWRRNEDRRPQDARCVRTKVKRVREWHPTAFGGTEHVGMECDEVDLVERKYVCGRGKVGDAEGHSP
jgi:hypothetical protein